MAGLFDNLIDYVKVSTAYGPDIVLNKPLQPAPASSKGSLMATLQPRVEIGVGGSSPIILQPYGKPPPTRWPILITSVGILGGALLALAVVGGRSVVKRRKK